jgi:hypothetical protein
MNRSLRRKFEKEFQTILRTKGDNCSCCGRPFQHNDRTHGGVKPTGQVAIVGDCCHQRLSIVYVGGVFSTRNNDFLVARAGKSLMEMRQF